MSTTVYQLYVDSTWRDASDGAVIEATNPYDRSFHGTVAVATESDVDEAVAATRRAFTQVWRQTTPGERARLLNKVADLIDANDDEIAPLENN